MSDDLVKRLRGGEFHLSREMWESQPLGEMCREAADEIERLRADKERLDWLDEFGLSAHIQGGDLWEVAGFGKQYGTGDTIRAAIDAARKLYRSMPQPLEKPSVKPSEDESRDIAYERECRISGKDVV